MALDPEVQTLANLLRDIAAMLNKHGEMRWAERVKRCLASVEQSDAYGLRQFLSFFGGMGSLNDVVLYQNARVLTGENEQLRILLSRAWELGQRLVREER